MRKLSESEVRDLCGEANYRNGLDYFRKGQVGQAARTEERLFAEVQGSGANPYRITITVKEDKVTPKCSCPAARRNPFCKHVAAVLLTWVQTPDKFVVGELEGRPESEQLAARKAETKVGRAKREKVSREDVLRSGLEAVEELVVDLCRRGLVAAPPERLAVLADMETNLQAHKLRRLSRAMTSLKGEMQRALTDPDSFNAARYAELLGDIWFTARAVRRYLNGELKDERLAEDLIGKTWRDPDLEEHRDLDLLELAYESFTTDSGFRLDVSYFVCVGGTEGEGLRGEILREMKIVPTHLKGPQTDPKPRYDRPLHVAR